MPAIRLAAALPASTVPEDLWRRLVALRDRPGRVRRAPVTVGDLRIEVVSVEPALLAPLAAVARREPSGVTVWQSGSIETSAFLPAIGGVANEHGAAIAALQGNIVQLNAVQTAPKR